jgi:hypothetical protein
VGLESDQQGSQRHWIGGVVARGEQPGTLDCVCARRNDKRTGGAGHHGVVTMLDVVDEWARQVRVGNKRVVVPSSGNGR